MIESPNKTLQQILSILKGASSNSDGKPNREIYSALAALCIHVDQMQEHLDLLKAKAAKDHRQNEA